MMKRIRQSVIGILLLLGLPGAWSGQARAQTGETIELDVIVAGSMNGDVHRQVWQQFVDGPGEDGEYVGEEYYGIARDGAAIRQLLQKLRQQGKSSILAEKHLLTPSGVTTRVVDDTNRVPEVSGFGGTPGPAFVLWDNLECLPLVEGDNKIRLHTKVGVSTSGVPYESARVYEPAGVLQDGQTFVIGLKGKGEHDHYVILVTARAIKVRVDVTIATLTDFKGHHCVKELLKDAVVMGKQYQGMAGDCGRLELFLAMLQESQLAKVEMQPVVVTVSGKQAGFLSQCDKSRVEVSGAGPFGIRFISFATLAYVTPTLLGNGTLSLDLAVNVNGQDEASSAKVIRTKTTVQDGQTIVAGFEGTGDQSVVVLVTATANDK